jgi:protease-4
MAQDAEMIADRRRVRRKLSFWRVVAVVALIGAVIAVGLRWVGPPDAISPRQPHIARVEISGMITSDRRLAEMLEEVSRSRAVQGVILSINSPGGTTSGAEELHRNLRRLAQDKPMVAFVEGTAASGAYIAAIASDHIVARETAIVGSIGTMFQMPHVREMLDSIGVSVIEVKSTPLKAEPSPTGPIEPEALAAIRELVEDSYIWFRDLVGDRRPLTEAERDAVSDGRVHSGRRALELKLVDALGDQRDAVAWLETTHDLPEDLAVRTWRPTTDRRALGLFSGAAWLADMAGWDQAGGLLRRVDSQITRVELDGLLALWQPVVEN